MSPPVMTLTTIGCLLTAKSESRKKSRISYLIDLQNLCYLKMMVTCGDLWILEHNSALYTGLYELARFLSHKGAKDRTRHRSYKR
jgi:hypothetical protein